MLGYRFGSLKSMFLSLEQKVDELSASPKNAGTETAPASSDTTKLEKLIIAMFGKEEEVRGKISS